MAWPRGKKRAGHKPPQVGPPRTAAAAGHPFTFVPLPEVPEHRRRGIQSPMSLALLEAFEQKQAVKIELRGKTLSQIVGASTTSLKAEGYRVRQRTVSDVGYVWLEKIDEKK